MVISYFDWLWAYLWWVGLEIDRQQTTCVLGDTEDQGVVLSAKHRTTEEGRQAVLRQCDSLRIRISCQSRKAERSLWWTLVSS